MYNLTFYWKRLERYFLQSFFWTFWIPSTSLNHWHHQHISNFTIEIYTFRTSITFLWGWKRILIYITQLCHSQRPNVIRQLNMYLLLTFPNKITKILSTDNRSRHAFVIRGGLLEPERVGTWWQQCFHHTGDSKNKLSRSKITTNFEAFGFHSQSIRIVNIHQS